MESSFRTVQALVVLYSDDVHKYHTYIFQFDENNRENYLKQTNVPVKGNATYV